MPRPDPAVPLKILFEDNHLLVIDKPALLPTMGVREGDDSLVVRAKDYLRIKYQKPGNVYLGVVSRLDSHVTGVIVLARTSKAASRLSEQFRNRSSEKIYLAIIPDRNEFAERGQLINRIVKNEAQHRMVCLPSTATRQPNEQSATLKYQTLGRNQGQRLIEIELVTGRKHQIRVQLSAAGVPILGDRKYDSDTHFPTGIALHSQRLTIEHPTIQSLQTFQSAPPSFWRLSRFGYDVGS